MPFLLEKYGESKKTFYSGLHLAYHPSGYAFGFDPGQADAINENAFSNFQRIGVDICSGCIRPEKGMDSGR
jgi:hypothetical protein